MNNITITSQNISKFNKRIKKELDKKNINLSFTECSEIFAKTLGFSSLHECQKIFSEENDIETKVIKILEEKFENQKDTTYLKIKNKSITVKHTLFENSTINFNITKNKDMKLLLIQFQKDNFKVNGHIKLHKEYSIKKLEMFNIFRENYYSVYSEFNPINHKNFFNKIGDFISIETMEKVFDTKIPSFFGRIFDCDDFDNPNHIIIDISETTKLYVPQSELIGGKPKLFVDGKQVLKNQFHFISWVKYNKQNKTIFFIQEIK